MTKESLYAKTILFLAVELLLACLLLYFDSKNITYIILAYITAWLMIIASILYLASIRGDICECTRENS